MPKTVAEAYLAAGCIHHRSVTPKVSVLPMAPKVSLFDALNKVADDSLLKIRDDLGECTRCKLHTTRNKIVFGDGSPKPTWFS